MKIFRELKSEVEKKRNSKGRDLILTRHSPKAVVDRMYKYIKEYV